MAKDFSSITEMIEEISGDDNFIQEFNESRKQKKFSTMLFRMRNHAEITQEELGKKVGLSADTIGGIENATHMELPIGVIFGIALALGYEVDMNFFPRNHLASRVVSHSEDLKNSLEKLLDLIEDDQEMKKGASDFIKFKTAIVEVINLISQLKRDGEEKPDFKFGKEDQEEITAKSLEQMLTSPQLLQR